MNQRKNNPMNSTNNSQDNFTDLTIRAPRRVGRRGHSSDRTDVVATAHGPVLERPPSFDGPCKGRY